MIKITRRSFIQGAAVGIIGAASAMNLLACSPQDNEATGETTSDALGMTDGQYSATTPSYAEMYGLATTGSMTMNIAVDNNKITKIEIPEATDTDIIGCMAYDILAEKVVETQSLNIDAISGATVSSAAFFAAIKDCITQAGGDPKVFESAKWEKPSPVQETMDVDVVVLGAGMAGLVAATRAAELGAKVVLLERNQVYSSSTTRSLGFVVGAGTAAQKELGIDDTTENFYADIAELYKDEKELDLELLKKICDDSTQVNSWLVDHGVEFTDVINKSEKGGRKTKRIHTTAGGSVLTSTLVTAVENSGAILKLGTPALSLIQEDDGSISGVLATNENSDEIIINADATIVCAGSYTNNKELFEELNPKIDNIAYECGCGDGDAYNWFVEADSDIVEIPYTQFMYYSYAANFEEFPEVIPNSPDNPVYDILLVTPEGERVTAEDNFCFEFTKENWNRGFNEGYAVVDQHFADEYPLLMGNVLTKTVPGSGLPFAYQADSIEELAKEVDMNGAALSETLARYNELCEKGNDDDFEKDAAYMRTLEAPYYIIRLPQVTTDGYTGARINSDAQVLNKNGEWIKGLYAAGSCAVGQTVSVNYFGCGTSLATCGVFGLAAAESASSSIV